MEANQNSTLFFLIFESDVFLAHKEGDMITILAKMTTVAGGKH